MEAVSADAGKVEADASVLTAHFDNPVGEVKVLAEDPQPASAKAPATIVAITPRIENCGTVRSWGIVHTVVLAGAQQAACSRGLPDPAVRHDFAIRRIAAMDRSTSASVVAHEITLTRIAVCPCQTVAPHQQVPSSWMATITRRVRSGSPKDTRTWLSTTSLSTRNPAAAKASAKRAASRQCRSTISASPDRPSDRRAAHASTPRGRRDTSGVYSDALMWSLGR